MTRPRRHALTVLGLSVLLATTLPTLAPGRYLLGGDPDHYVLLASALSQGEPYEMNGRPETKFPPGFPLMLVPAALLHRNDFGAASRWAAFLAALVFPIVWWWAARRGSQFPLAIGIATVTSVTFLRFATGNPMAEPAYTALSIAFLAWADIWHSGTGSRRWRSVLPGALLLTMSVAVRSAGIALVAAYAVTVAVHAVKDRPRVRTVGQDLVPLILSAAFTASWFLWTARMRRPWFTGEYMDSYASSMFLSNPHQPEQGTASALEILARLASGLRVQAAHAVELLTQIPWIQPAWLSPLIIVPALLVLGGLAQDIRRRRVLCPVYFASYVFLIALWPFDEGRRFLLPILPLLVLYAGQGVALLLTVIRSEDRRVWGWTRVLAAACLAGILLGGFRSGKHFSTQELLSAFAWTGLLIGATLPVRRPVERLAGYLTVHPLPVITAATIAFAAIGVARALPEFTAQLRNQGPTEPVAAALDQASVWLEANTSTKAVVQATFADRLHAATGRRVVPLPVSTNPATFSEIDKAYAPKYLVVLDPSPFPYYRPTDPERLVILRSALGVNPVEVHAFPGGQIYALR